MLRRLTKPISLLLTLPFAALRLAEKPARLRWSRPKPQRTAPKVAFGVYAKLAETDQSQQDANRWLAVENYPQAEQWRGGGGGGVVTVGKVVIDGHGAGGGDSYRSRNHEIETGGGHGAMQLGVLLIDTPFIRVYPLVGIGGTGGGVSLAPVASNNGSEPHRTSWIAMLVSGGIGADFRLPLGWLNVWIGLRAGYQVPTFNVQIGEGVEVGVQPRPFFRILLGTGLVPPTDR